MKARFMKHGTVISSENTEDVDCLVTMAKLLGGQSVPVSLWRRGSECRLSILKHRGGTESERLEREEQP